MYVYVLTREIVGGEPEDNNTSDIVAVMSDVAALSDRVPVVEFRCVDPELIDSVDHAFDYNTVECYVIRRFDLETGNEVDDSRTIFWSVKDLRGIGLDISD